MRRLYSMLFVALCAGVAAVATGAEVPAYIGKHVASAADTAAINAVVNQFQTAIKSHDAKLLSSLVLNSNILFDAPAPPAAIAVVRGRVDVTYDGLRAGGFNQFSRFIGESKDALEEKFYNVQITQDGNVAWVMFDYEFVSNGKVSNYGVETWQMMQNADGQWKIASVMWSMNRLPG